jgi:radical SAM protein with 4Fe4S-binding SPASM domain
VINFRKGSIERFDLTTGRIMTFIERGHSLPDIASELNQSPQYINARIEDLRSRDIVQSSPNYKKVEKKVSPKLKNLFLEITGRCNLNCIHCYARASKQPGNLDLPYDIIAKTIHESAKLGCSYIQFTGGEPTLRDDLQRLILEAKNSGIPKIDVFSNGVSVPEPLIDFFFREEINLAISFYSYRAEVHDSITGVRGSQRQTLKNLKLIVAKGISIYCEMIVMNANRNDLQGTAKLLNSLGIELSNSPPVLPIGRGVGEKATLDWDAYSQNIGDHTCCPDFSDFNRRRKWNACWYGKAAITFNGDVTPCVFAREQVAGNVTLESLTHIIKGKMLEYWGLNKDKVDTCRDCEYRYSCFDCPPLTYSLTGSLYNKPPQCKYDPYLGRFTQ